MSPSQAAWSIVSCEHAGNRVPAKLRERAAGLARALQGPRGFDAGALLLAGALARRLRGPLYASSITRLLVDANRSAHNPTVFGALGRGLARAERAAALERWYRPYRDRVEGAIWSRSRRRRVVHLAIHTFAPGPRGLRGDTHFGILYDPRRPLERAFASRLRSATLRHCPELRVRRNHPFLGRADGLATAMRRRLGARRYLGIELELSQTIAALPAAEWRDLRRRLVEAIALAVGETEDRGWSPSARRRSRAAPRRRSRAAPPRRRARARQPARR
jgi:predicted N-formylglutamate amidohydrolase